jgi:multidrug resistance protein
MLAPTVPDVMASFHSTSSVLGSFVVSANAVGFIIGPLVVAPLSEVFGRLMIYHASNILYLLFTAGCATSQNISWFISSRVLAGCVGVAPLALGGGSIGDIIHEERMGLAMAIWGTSSLFGPVVGPIIGGYIGEAFGWRWVFWVVAIMVSPIELLAVLPKY